MYTVTNGKCNIAMGSVLSIWHKYREQGIDDRNPLNFRLWRIWSALRSTAASTI